METNMDDRSKCIAVLPAGETCPNCGWAYGDLDPHPILPDTYKCAKCHSPYNLDQLACSQCGRVPGMEYVGGRLSKDARAELLAAKNELRRVRGLPPLEDNGPPPAAPVEMKLGRLAAPATADRCARCQSPWNLDALRCSACGFLPPSSSELLALLKAKNAKLASLNRPPISSDGPQAAPPPGRSVMHPTEGDIRASQPRDAILEGRDVGAVVRWP
jgi:ribosomal protein L37E